jgi:hypothetical protein
MEGGDGNLLFVFLQQLLTKNANTPANIRNPKKKSPDDDELEVVD